MIFHSYGNNHYDDENHKYGNGDDDDNDDGCCDEYKYLLLLLNIIIQSPCLQRNFPSCFELMPIFMVFLHHCAMWQIEDKYKIPKN